MIKQYEGFEEDLLIRLRTIEERSKEITRHLMEQEANRTTAMRTEIENLAAQLLPDEDVDDMMKEFRGHEEELLKRLQIIKERSVRVSRGMGALQTDLGSELSGPATPCGQTVAMENSIVVTSPLTPGTMETQQSPSSSKLSPPPMHVPMASPKKGIVRKRSKVHVAFVGNSIQYFNDCPRLLEQMLKTHFDEVVQDSCLRGGASLASLLNDGNGMQKKFATLPAERSDGSYDIGSATVELLLKDRCWDFVVMNDHTQGPTRTKSKELTKKALEQYAALLEQSRATTVFLQTAAYRVPNIKKTEDLGDFEEFSDRLQVGYHEYAAYMKTLHPDLATRVAPVGEAFRWLHRHKKALWETLYSWDDFHFSPSGTWLEACVLYCTMLHQQPPLYNPNWWNACRIMQPQGEKPMPLPTDSEALELRRVACLVCGVPETLE